MMKKVVIAIDSFKGCVTSAEANRAAAEGVRMAWTDAEVVEIPVSDGGEGWLEAFHATISELDDESLLQVYSQYCHRHGIPSAEMEKLFNENRQ